MTQEYNKKFEVDFDDIWTLRENMKAIEKRVKNIRKLTRSIHIKEILIDEGITDTLEKNFRILNKYKL